jgi:hypothetical protein
MSWWQQLVNPVRQAAQQAVRMATTNPAVAPILRQYRRLPAPVREGINPLTSRPTQTKRGGLGAAGVNMARNTALGIIADSLLPDRAVTKYLDPILNVETGLAMARVNPVVGALYAGVVDPLLNPPPAGANEMEMLAQARREGWGAPGMAGATSPAVAATDQTTQATLGQPSPPPAAGPRVETSTVRTRLVAPAPAQTQTLAPISQAALTAADTGFEAPATVPLRQFYSAQDFLGKELEKTGELQRRLKEAGGAAGMSDSALMTWAQKNPGLAYREMMRREAMAAPGIAD